MNTKLKTLVQALVDEINESKGAKDAALPEAEWWRLLNWKTPDYRTLFDSLGEETRTLIIDAGLCPECDEEEECEEGYEKNEEGECVPMEEEEDKSLPYEDGEALDFTLTPLTSIDEHDLKQDWYVEQELGIDAVLSYKSKAGHPDSDYAYIEEGCEKKDGKTQQSCRHLLIHDPAHVRAALAALGGARSGKVPSYAEKAKPKVCAAAKKFKIESEICKPKKKDALDPYEVMRRADKLLNPLTP